MARWRRNRPDNAVPMRHSRERGHMERWKGTDRTMQYPCAIAESADIWNGGRGGPFPMTTEPNEAQLSCGSSPEDMSDEALAALVRDGLKKFAKIVPYVRELRNRFGALPRGHANIMGCKTWSEFCERVLD